MRNERLFVAMQLPQRKENNFYFTKAVVLLFTPSLAIAVYRCDMQLLQIL